MRLYIGSQKIDVIKCDKPKLTTHAGRCWDIGKIIIDEQEVLVHFDNTRGEYLYFQQDWQWYKFRMSSTAADDLERNTWEVRPADPGEKTKLTTFPRVKLSEKEECEKFYFMLAHTNVAAFQANLKNSSSFDVKEGETLAICNSFYREENEYLIIHERFILQVGYILDMGDEDKDFGQWSKEYYMEEVGKQYGFKRNAGMAVIKKAIESEKSLYLGQLFVPVHRNTKKETK